MSEQWRTIEGHPDYAVSSLGRVKRVVDSKCGFKAGRVLSSAPGKNGYPMVQLWHNQKPKKLYVHHLVLEAFVGPRPDGCICNHKDCNRSNNRPENLEWTSQSNNVKQTYSLKRRIWDPKRGESNGRAILKEGEVWLIKKLISKKVTQKVIGKMFRISQAHVSLIATEKEWAHVVYP